MSNAGLLYAGCNGHVVAIDPASGAETWKVDLTGFASITVDEDVSVIARGRQVFAGCHGHVFCLDAATGELLWHNELEGLGWNDVSLCVEGQSVQYITTHETVEVESDSGQDA